MERIRKYIKQVIYGNEVKHTKTTNKELSSTNKKKTSKLFGIIQKPYKKVYCFFGIKWTRHKHDAKLLDLIKKNQSDIIGVIQKNKLDILDIIKQNQKEF